MNNKINYFAYGLNLSKKQMSSICLDSIPRISVVLPNYKLIFAGYSRNWNCGTASIKPFKGQRVNGAIYEISPADLKKLDTFEGYPLLYDRINITVWTDTGSSLQAIAYIKKEQTPESKPSPQYLSLIMQGFRDWQIE